MASLFLLIQTACAPRIQTDAMPPQPHLGVRTARIVANGELRFRDLDHDGQLTPYEDWRLLPQTRAADLVARMTLEEKAGTMLHAVARGAGSRGGESRSGYDLADAERVIGARHITNLLTRIAVPPATLAEQNNALQAVAERSRLGIPLTISTDPRSHFNYVVGATSRNMGFSQWPDTLGFGALGDAALVERFAGIAAREYRATGITMALSPQIDIATEPRWARFSGTFGSDPDMIGRLGAAYIRGFQGGNAGVTSQGVVTIAKHWVGYGAAKDGWDSHSAYGRFATLTADTLPLHIRPFEAAFGASVEGVMPTYSVPQGLTIDGRPVEQVGAAFSRTMLTDLLRSRYGFRGLIVSDWLVTQDCRAPCESGASAGQRPDPADFGMPWGVEAMSVEQRFARAIDAGVDQFGGVDTTDRLVAAIRQANISAARIDASVTRILIHKFKQGLFENPYVDATATAARVGTPADMAAGREAQARAAVLLKNAQGLLPLAGAARRIWLHGISAEVAIRNGFIVVADPRQAEIALIRAETPFQRPHANYLFGGFHREGDLDFKPDNADRVALERAHRAGIPTVFAITLERPAILTEILPSADVVLANFGMSDMALFDALTGRTPPGGRLPFELPRSMAAVLAQRSDRPNDTVDPLFPAGSGLVMRSWTEAQ
ncbi:MAG TPA: glycoside hydrolase family 3 N-terminal domain-containing protein [Sphingomonas sp.]|nr:glycoside hydrolase family 3 N-terminal domain-containing protein [Sphingomonas sp.]